MLRLVLFGIVAVAWVAWGVADALAHRRRMAEVRRIALRRHGRAVAAGREFRARRAVSGSGAVHSRA